MKRIIHIQKKIVPEFFAIMEKRYNILRNILALQPVGRRVLANKLSVGERIVRSEVEFLKKQGLIGVAPTGMTITKEGQEVIEELKEFIYNARGIRDLEETLKKELNINEVLIVPGNSDEDEYVLEDLGRVTGEVLERKIPKNHVIGVTGGSTMATVAKKMPQHPKKREIIVVPARGGLGSRVENQANTVAAEMAMKMNADYQLLHASDTLSEEAIESLLKDPEIKKILEIIRSAQLLVFGIGRADRMAKRRELSQDTLDYLKNHKAVAEAFGYYFNRQGKIVYEMKTIGINFNDFQKAPHVIGVAGGKKKAQAILAIVILKKSMTLVTDESAALEILNLTKNIEHS